MELLLQLLGVTAITLVAGWFCAVLMDRIKDNLTKPDE
jgi:hypothetical protein